MGTTMLKALLSRLLSRYQKDKRIEAELMAAYALLPRDIVESADGYCEADFLTYINHNELLLALEELEGVIVDNGLQTKQFWTHLIQAAKIMNHAHAERYRSIQSAANY
ncbi:hypothetical protein N478_00700 [Pseudoalteromonas luteoviolacea S4060-1]|uniref:Uncharacterized protein n=2 Tax=Pseudoalteromonas luteoviolacea TaxID=43657 RepID=A0A167PEF2_9GAMM|nr:hypothetical protein N478_00700 [Pseudoalteromonas luteoviolacea S4060-1]